MKKNIITFLLCWSMPALLWAQKFIAFEQKAGATPIVPVLKEKLEAPQVLNAPDGYYYLTGLRKNDNRNVPLYRSADLKNWVNMGNVLHTASYFQAPEIHFFKNSYWIVVSHSEQLQLYKGRKAKGPYSLWSTLGGGRSPSLFEDKNGKMYLLFGDREITPLSDDLKKATAPPLRLTPANRKGSFPGWATEATVTDRIGTDGAFMRYENGKYFLYCNDWATRLSTKLNETYYAISDSIMGPYSQRKQALLNSGQASIFTAKDGSFYAVFSPLPSDNMVVTKEMPVIEKLLKNDEGGFRYTGEHSLLKEPWASLSPRHPADMRDPSIHLGPDGYYYLVYTAGWGESKVPETTITLWRSKDLVKWDSVANLLHWDRLGTQFNGKAISLPAVQRVWAPEINYIRSKKMWLLSFSMPMSGENGGSQSWVFKSKTAEGPYTNITTGALVQGIDGFTFEDEDGSVYFIWGGGNIAKMTDELDGLAESNRFMAGFNGAEGMSLVKINGKYMLTKSSNVGEASVGTYDTRYGVGDNVYGPYEFKGAIPHGGHSTWFKGADGQWRMTIFGSDGSCPIHQRLGIFRFDVNKDFIVTPKKDKD